MMEYGMANSYIEVMGDDGTFWVAETGNATYYARLENLACDGNNLLLEDVQWGLQIYFTL